MNWTPPPSPGTQQQPQRQPLLPPFSTLLSFMGAPAGNYHQHSSHAPRLGERWMTSAEGTAAGVDAHSLPLGRSNRCAPNTTISRLLWTVIQLLSIKIANLAEQGLSGRVTDKDQMTALIAKLAGCLPYLTLTGDDAALKLVEAGSAELDSIPPSPLASSLPAALPPALSYRSSPPHSTLYRASRSTSGKGRQGTPREGEETPGASCGVDSNDDEKGGASSDGGGGAVTAISPIVIPLDSSPPADLRAAGLVAAAHTIPEGGEFWPHQPGSDLTSSPPSLITPPWSSPGSPSPLLARPTTDSGRLAHRPFHGDRTERCGGHPPVWRRGNDESRLCNACELERPHNKRVLYDDERASCHTRRKRARDTPAQLPARAGDEMVERNGGSVGSLPEGEAATVGVRGQPTWRRPAT